MLTGFILIIMIVVSIAIIMVLTRVTIRFTIRGAVWVEVLFACGLLFVLRVCLGLVCLSPRVPVPNVQTSHAVHVAHDYTPLNVCCLNGYANRKLPFKDRLIFIHITEGSPVDPFNSRLKELLNSQIPLHQLVGPLKQTFSSL